MFENREKPYKLNSMRNEKMPWAAENFSYFGDCLDFNLNFSGRFSTIPFSNHLTEIDSLIFIAEFREKMDLPKTGYYKAAFKHIKFLIDTQPLFKADDPYVKKHFSDLPNRFSSIASISGTPKDILTKVKSELQKLRAELDEDFMKNIVEMTYKSIQCKEHKPKTHIKTFDYLSKIAFAYFYSAGYSRKEIRWFVSELLQREVTKSDTDHRIYIRGPLPPPLYSKLIDHNSNGTAFSQELFDEIKYYYDNRTLKQQVEGFYNLSARKKDTYSFLFRIDNLKFRQDFIDLENIRIFESEYFIKKYKANMDYISTSFFDEKSQNYSFSFAHIEVSTYSMELGVFEAINQLKELLNRLKLMFNTHCQVNTMSYIANFEQDVQKDFAENLVTERTVLYDFEVGRFSKLNDNYKLTHHPEFVKQIDSIIASAYADQEIHRSLSTYWKTCDVLIGRMNKDLGKLGAGDLSPDVVILSLMSTFFEKKVYRFYLKIWVYNIINNNEDGALKSGEKIKKFYSRNQLRKIPGLSRLLKDVKHEHLRYRIRQAHNYDKNNPIDKVFDYYLRYYKLLWCVRNSNVHFNERNAGVEHNIHHFTHHIVQDLRNELFLQLKKSGKTKNPKIIMEELCTQSRTALGIS